MTGITRRDFIKSSLGAAAYLALPYKTLWPQDGIGPDWYRDKSFSYEPAPREFGEFVETQVNEIFRKRYAKEIGMNRFFHGHMIMEDKGIEDYRPVDEVLSDVKYILYHTDDIGRRWNEEERDLIFYDKTPRSVVGRRNGRVEPAIGLTMWNGFGYVELAEDERMHEYELYMQSGSIGREVIIKSLSELWGEKLTSEPQKVLIEEKTFSMDSEFFIEKSFYGPYRTWMDSFNVMLKLKPGA